MENITVAWFSAGVSSAVAIKTAAVPITEIIYTHIQDQHADTMRFVHDCEAWFDQPVTVLQSPYLCVENAVYGSGGRGYINGPRGAACTRFLKRRVREEWEAEHDDFMITYIWGFDASEASRAERLTERMPNQQHVFPLIENGITKEIAHQMLQANGIRRPAMYDLGYQNNNCVGCVKGGQGYWNKIRKDFPEVFANRAAMERKVQATCISGIYLDELSPDAGRNQAPVCNDCGILCETMLL